MSPISQEFYKTRFSRRWHTFLRGLRRKNMRNAAKLSLSLRSFVAQIDFCFAVEGTHKVRQHSGVSRKPRVSARLRVAPGGSPGVSGAKECAHAVIIPCATPRAAVD
jgi:hypothetical protein